MGDRRMSETVSSKGIICIEGVESVFKSGGVGRQGKRVMREKSQSSAIVSADKNRPVIVSDECRYEQKGTVQGGACRVREMSVEQIGIAGECIAKALCKGRREVVACGAVWRQAVHSFECKREEILAEVV